MKNNNLGAFISNLLEEESKLRLAVKANILVKGQKVDCCSKVLSNFIAPFSATVVEKALASGDIVINGITNMDEFAVGSSGLNTIHQRPVNFLNSDLIPGGSSSGSALAVAAGLSDFSFGSDTGGSVRLPAAYNGIAAFKPSWGRISRWGLILFSSSMDQIGIFGKDIKKIEYLFNLVKGEDRKDNITTERKNNIDFSSEKLLFLSDRIVRKFSEPFIADSYLSILNWFSNRASIEIIDDPKVEELFNRGLEIYRVISSSELLSNLSRFFSSLFYYKLNNHSGNFKKFQKESYSNFSQVVKDRLEEGRRALSTFLWSEIGRINLYQEMRLERKRMEIELKEILGRKVFLLPTTTLLSISKEEFLSKKKDLKFLDVFTVIANLSYLPSVCFPILRLRNEFNIPFSLQLVSDQYTDESLLEFGGNLEKEIQSI